MAMNRVARSSARTVPRVAAALTAAGMLASCSAGSTATQVGRVAGAGVVVGTSGAPASLDFTTTGGAAIPQALMSNVYETLVRIDEHGQPVPHLAERVERDDDGLRYTFHLRHGVQFSNGDEFTAETAAFSINYVKNEWTNGLKAHMDPVASVNVVDKHTLVVTLSAPSNRWLWSMGTLTGAMMTPAGIDTLATDPIGTGPYTVDRFNVGESIVFSARDDYWSTPAHHDAAIRYFADSVASVNALRAGDVDVVWALQAPELLDSLPDEYGVQVGSTNGEVIFSMNNNLAPFDDPTVRQAAAYAIDRDALNHVVYEGMGTNTGGAPVPPSDPWFTGHDYYPFDPARADELLAGRTPEVTISVPSLPYAQKAAELIYSQLTEVGFRVSLETVEFPAVWLGQVMNQQNYQASIIAHVEPRDIPTLFGNPDYYLGYDSANVRKYLKLADQGDTTTQITHMEAAVDQIMADAGALTLANSPNIVLTAPGVTGIKADVITDALPLAGVNRP
ncbi:ABC transporter substrate-binding protein [Corynebacterium cystitidis]|uniref:Peptide/nickel transport system substrate-binding protein n=1 Tax=Corynebacterium cystitidis DSM 20524 TaxID=1121357 RepID=A0A1H9SWD5_9CORY|nr:ABC transporter substrate-binding protein [Corynebacterium cystitidis]WJY83196.1 Heme-binding protein A precursor [Corynebacterium cystitidis DSM 20524]SER88693.1 peptide/nickel transport system substrate-binding protein [Corynebacterium cystitidis DSM 20524]SNV67371.1 ABC transporter substrate-binding protein [Corynebacterium cystitidis]